MADTQDTIKKNVQRILKVRNKLKNTMSPCTLHMIDDFNTWYVVIDEDQVYKHSIDNDNAPECITVYDMPCGRYEYFSNIQYMYASYILFVGDATQSDAHKALFDLYDSLTCNLHMMVKSQRNISYDSHECIANSKLSFKTVLDEVVEIRTNVRVSDDSIERRKLGKPILPSKLVDGFGLHLVIIADALRSVPSKELQRGRLYTDNVCHLLRELGYRVIQSECHNTFRRAV